MSNQNIKKREKNDIEAQKRRKTMNDNNVDGVIALSNQLKNSKALVM